MPDILFILVLALVIFGPKRLPEVMRQVAKFMAQFRMMRDDLKRQLEGEMLKIELEERQKQKTVATPAPTAQLPVTTAPPPPSESVPTSQSSSALDGNISATG
jgi:sec-independent protein translocase protein TatB